MKSARVVLSKDSFVHPDWADGTEPVVDRLIAPVRVTDVKRCVRRPERPVINKCGCAVLVRPWEVQVDLSIVSVHHAHE